MLIDYGASTSVMARSVVDELEKRTGAYIPRINTHMNIKGYGGHDIPSEGTIMVKLKIGNKHFITPFTIVSHETATKVVLGTSLLVKAKIGLAWKNDQVSLTFEQHERTEFAQAHLAEATAHNMACIHEIVLSPKESVISSIKHPHAY